MKPFAEMNDIAVIVLVSVCLLSNLWWMVFHAYRLKQAVKEWQDTGPHTTTLGKVRERLAAGGWVAAPRDPLAECGIPAGDDWKQVLHFMLHSAQSVACMERQVHLAHKEHEAFSVAFQLGVANISLFALWLVWWAFVRRHHQPDAVATQDLLPFEGSSGASHEARLVNEDDLADDEQDLTDNEQDNAVNEQDIALKHIGRANSWPRGVSRKSAVSVVKERLSSSLTKLDSCVKNVAPLETPLDPRRDRVKHEEQLQEAIRIIRRSLHLPPRFRERLAGPSDCFLEHLRRHHSVLIFMDHAKKKIHIKGAEKDVTECYTSVKALLAEWKTSDATTSS